MITHKVCGSWYRNNMVYQLKIWAAYGGLLNLSKHIPLTHVNLNSIILTSNTSK